MGLLSSLLPSVFKPALPAWAAAQGITQNSDGTISMPDGTTGRINSDGSITLSSGETIADLGDNNGLDVTPTNGQPDQPHITPGAGPTGSGGDAWWKHWSTVVSQIELTTQAATAHVEGLTIGGAVGLIVGAVAGTAMAGPIGAKALGGAGAGLGAFIGYKIAGSL